MSYAPYIAKIKMVLYIQAVVALVASGLWAVFGNALEFKSALLGGMIAVVPNSLFAFKLIQATGKSYKNIEKAFYLGECIKLLSTALLFGIVIIYVEISFFPLMLVFTTVLSVFWFLLLTLR